MIVDSAWYRDCKRHAVDVTPGLLEKLREHPSEERGFVWVGLHEPDESEMELMQNVFDLHPLAVEDAMSSRQRPKVEPYADMLFMVLKTLWYVDERDEVETGHGDDDHWVVQFGHDRLEWCRAAGHSDPVTQLSSFSPGCSRPFNAVRSTGRGNP